jgi:protein-disulfide isomerase
MYHRSLPRHRSLHAVCLAATLMVFAVAAQACAQPGTPARGADAAVDGGSPPVPLDSVRARADRGRMKGSADAPVTIIEISDFQCPFCREWAVNTFPQLDSAYIQTGRVRLLFIHYPLPHHGQSWAASEAAACAGAQGRFWEMHDHVFATQREWSGQPDAADRFERFAGEMGLDMAEYRDCTVYDRTASLIVSDATQAAQAGITGTPSFILNGQQMLAGAIPFEQMREAIDALLEGADAPPAEPGDE